MFYQEHHLQEHVNYMPMIALVKTWLRAPVTQDNEIGQVSAVWIDPGTSQLYALMDIHDPRYVQMIRIHDIV